MSGPYSAFGHMGFLSMCETVEEIHLFFLKVCPLMAVKREQKIRLCKLLNWFRNPKCKLYLFL